MKRFILLLGMAAFPACAELSACQNAPAGSTTLTETKDVLADANVAYKAFADVESLAGSYCTGSPADGFCASLPFAKIQAFDSQIYADLTAANTAAAAGDATAQSIALAAVKTELSSALALIPTSSNPNINALVAVLKLAVTTFVSDLGSS